MPFPALVVVARGLSLGAVPGALIGSSMNGSLPEALAMMPLALLG